MKIDSMHIMWPDWKMQTLYNIPSDQMITLFYNEAMPGTLNKRKSPDKVKFFVTSSGRRKIEFKHNERKFNDFDIQPLVPHMYSQEGPGIAVGDANSDGMDDFFIGGSTSYSGNIFIQEKDGSFSSR